MTTIAWVPTHKITFTPMNGARQVDYVMLLNGSAYSRPEWDAADSADWTVEDGEWHWRDQVTPGGQNGEVEIETLPGGDYAVSFSRGEDLSEEVEGFLKLEEERSPIALGEILALCAEHGISAKLFDEAGLSRGYVKADGGYSLS